MKQYMEIQTEGKALKIGDLGRKEQRKMNRTSGVPLRTNMHNRSTPRVEVERHKKKYLKKYRYRTFQI